jgi:hypothetical protein
MSDPEVGQKCSAMVINQDVRRLDIAMDDAFEMSVFQSLRNL